MRVCVRECSLRFGYILGMYLCEVVHVLLYLTKHTRKGGHSPYINYHVFMLVCLCYMYIHVNLWAVGPRNKLELDLESTSRLI